MNTEKKVKAYIQKENLIEKGDKILLGLSGGADSVCLFYLLLGLRKELEFELRAAHVHHGIRTEADSDAAFVQALCEKEGIRLDVFRENVPAYAKERRLSEEEAGRILRYADFEKSLKRWENENASLSGENHRGVKGHEEILPDAGSVGTLSSRYKVATAHHENDQAETVLFQLFRGCGLAGLRGILPGRDHIIRPLLCLSRAEIEGFLRENGFSWREDKTNQAQDYSRNKIRHRILPYAEREITPGASAHIAKTAEIVREAEHYIRRQTEKTYSRMAKEQEDAVVFEIPALRKEDIFLQKQLLLYAFGRLLADRKDIGAVHVEDVLRLAGTQGNGELFLPDKIRVKKIYQKLILFRKTREDSENREQNGNREWNGNREQNGSRAERELLLPAVLFEGKQFLYGEKAPEMKWEKIDLTEEQNVKERFGIREVSEILHCIPQKTYTKWFDYDKIKMPFSVRHPERGDYLTIDGEMRHKSFRRYMMENKIPAACRNRIWIITDSSHVIWAPGGRMSAYYKVTTQTKTILQVQICRGE